MDKPTNVLAELEHKTSILYFADETSAEYHMRGAICFPVLVERMIDGKLSQDIEGFALMAGQEQWP